MNLLQTVDHLAARKDQRREPVEGNEVLSVIQRRLLAKLPTDAEASPAVNAFRETVKRYAGLPFYRKVLDASGYAEELARGEVGDGMVDDLAGIGDAAAVRDAVARYREAGVTLPALGPLPKSAGAVGFEETLEVAIAA